MSSESEAAPISFPKAMECTASWLAEWEAGELSDEVLADRVGELVASRDGARGFFVVSLSAVSPLMDRLPEPLVVALRGAGEAVVDLSVRNLAMSTAMAMHHDRAGDHEQQARSQQVQERSSELLRQLDPVLVKLRLETLVEACAQESGSDLPFLERWGYDQEQREAIQAAALSVAE